MKGPFFTFVLTSISSAALSAFVSARAHAQQSPPASPQQLAPPDAPPGGGPGPGQPRAEDRVGPRRMMESGDPGLDGRGPDGRGPMGRGGPYAPSGSAAFEQLEVMRGYLDLVDRYSRMSRDPVSSGVAAVVMAADVLKPKGPQAAIDYFNKVLPDVKNPTVQRAIHLQLADLYKQSQQPDKALDELKAVMLMPRETDQATMLPPPPPPGGGPGRR